MLQKPSWLVHLGVAVISVIATIPVAFAADGKIYVIREADGVVRFTTKAPSAGEQAEIFTARANGFTYHRKARLKSSRRLYSASLYERAIYDAARRHRVDPNLIKAVIHVESGFNPRAVSPKGAKGLMQLMPGCSVFVMHSYLSGTFTGAPNTSRNSSSVTEMSRSPSRRTTLAMFPFRDITVFLPFLRLRSM